MKCHQNAAISTLCFEKGDGQPYYLVVSENNIDMLSNDVNSECEQLQR